MHYRYVRIGLAQALNVEAIGTALPNRNFGHPRGGGGATKRGRHAGGGSIAVHTAAQRRHNDAQEYGSE